MNSAQKGCVEHLPWGTHACQFYRSPADLVEMLVPYFSAGLRANEACLWVTSAALEAREVKELMREAVPEFGARLAKGQIEIRDIKDWYTPGSRFDGDDVLEAWLEQEQRALKGGYAGLRLTGDTSWVERAAWGEFMEYERKVDEVFARHRLIALCTYSLDRCSAEDVMEIARRHEFALIRGGASWERIADPAETALQIPGPAPVSPPTLGDVLYARKPKVLVAERDWAGLVRAAASGDQGALHELYQRANRPVFTLALRITGSREAAEEVTLDVFHDVWRRASRYDPANGTVLGWIMNQARSRSIDRVRFEQRKKRSDDGFPAEAANEPAQAANDPVEYVEQAAALQSALASLSADERKAIEAAFFDELTHVEVAARLNEPLGTIKTRIRSGLHKLRGALEAGRDGR